MRGLRVGADVNMDAALSWPAIKRYFPAQKVDTYVRPLPEHNVVYVKNPKAGCSTILVWLDRLHTGEEDFRFTNIHKEHRLPTIGDVGRRVVLRMLSGAAYRFSFVRNPLRRFESAYWDKLVRSGRYRLKAAAELGLPSDPDTIVTFEQFLGAVEQQDPVSEMDPHWRPQHINLLHPLVAYDHVGRLESFADDLERVREEAGLPHVPIEAKNASRSSKSPDSVFDGRPDLVRRVERLYAKDFELYGYSA
jgi:Sulfotransferase family